VHDGRPVSCRDAIDEERWPWWAAEALRRGLRSSIHLVRQSASTTLVLALFGARPGALDADGVPMAEMLARFGSTVFANSLAYGQAQRTATQLKDSVAARAVTDQAKGILMHALGCDADEALRYLRRESQRRHVKVTEVAARVIATYAPGGRVTPASLASSLPQSEARSVGRRAQSGGALSQEARTSGAFPQDLRAGRRCRARSTRMRSSGVVPPQMPADSRVRIANSRHSCLTGQPSQIRSARVTWGLAAAPTATGKNRSGSAVRQAPSARQSVAYSIICRPP
jgi:hypothetical protein